MTIYLRIPKPSHLLSRLSPREGPDAAVRQVLTQLADLHQLGDIESCDRAPQSANSTNFVVKTMAGKFVFRRHRLSEETVAHEHQVLDHLQRRGFAAPRVIPNQDGKTWSAIDGYLYSVYEFVDGHFLYDFFWWPSVRRSMLHQAGRTLGLYHQVVADLVPSFTKWDGYRPTGHRRWRGGDWFRPAVKDIRLLLRKRATYSPLDDYVRSHLDAIERMLGLESIVEERTDLSKVVIHGDYAPWNLLWRRGQPPCVLDFNSARLDLRIFDVVLATFWFAWHDGRLDRTRAMAFQTGYCETGQLREVDVELASDVFQWVMARAMAERLRRHYQEHVILQGPKSTERFFNMCVFASQQPHQLVSGLEGITGCDSDA